MFLYREVVGIVPIGNACFPVNIKAVVNLIFPHHLNQRFGLFIYLCTSQLTEPACDFFVRYQLIVGKALPVNRVRSSPCRISRIIFRSLQDSGCPALHTSMHGPDQCRYPSHLKIHNHPSLSLRSLDFFLKLHSVAIRIASKIEPHIRSRGNRTLERFPILFDNFPGVLNSKAYRHSASEILCYCPPLTDQFDKSGAFLAQHGDLIASLVGKLFHYRKSKKISVKSQTPVQIAYFQYCKNKFHSFHLSLTSLQYIPSV